MCRLIVKSVVTALSCLIQCLEMTKTIVCWRPHCPFTLLCLSPIHFPRSRSSMTNSAAFVYFDTHTHTHTHTHIHTRHPDFFSLSLSLRRAFLHKRKAATEEFNLTAQSKWIIDQHLFFFFFPVCVCWPKTLKVLANIWLWCNTGLPESTSLGSQCWGFNWYKLPLWKISTCFLLSFYASKST